MIKQLRTEEEWLAERKKVITATELPALLGLNPWTSPNKVMKEKENSTFSGNAYTIIGQILEPAVVMATNYLLKEDKFTIIEDKGVKEFYLHDTIRLGATPDAIDLKNKQFLECKTTKLANIERWKHSPPDYYVMQLIAQLMCAGWETGYLALMGTNLEQTTEELNLPVHIYKVRVNKRLEELAEQEVNRYWNTYEEGKSIRVDSKVKKEARALIQTCYQKVASGVPDQDLDSIKEKLGI